MTALLLSIQTERRGLCLLSNLKTSKKREDFLTAGLFASAFLNNVTKLIIITLQDIHLPLWHERAWISGINKYTQYTFIIPITLPLTDVTHHWHHIYQHMNSDCLQSPDIDSRHCDSRVQRRDQHGISWLSMRTGWPLFLLQSSFLLVGWKFVALFQRRVTCLVHLYSYLGRNSRP